MARLIQQLTEAKIRTLTAGLQHDGAGLYLQIKLCVFKQKTAYEIETNDVLAVLKPIWESKCETAARLRGRIERILARATVEGHRSGANCAAWRGHLQEALPARSEVQPVKHFRAMDYQDVPAFMAELGQVDTVAAASLRFLILC